MAGSQFERMAGAIGDTTTAATALARFRTRLGIDVRAIAAFRIGLGLVALVDLLALRLPGLVTFYTDQGVLSRAALAEVSPTLAQWSIHAQSGAAWFQALLLGVTGLAAVWVLVGYRSRVAAVVLAGLLASMHARNPYLVNGGDTVFISLCLFGAALPLDARWAVRPRGHWTSERIVSTGTAVLSLHVVAIYAINAILKLQSDAWMRGDAVQRIFQLEDFTFLLGPTLSAHPFVLTGINWLWVATISAAVGLVVFTGWARLAVVAAFVCAHLGMAMTLRLGAFPFVMCVAVVPFLPPLVWDRVERVLAERQRGCSLSSVTRATGFELPEANTRLTVPASLQRCLDTVGALALVGVFVAVLGWQVAAADLVERGAADDDGVLEGASWEFFAPDPPSSYSWYVAEADRDGEESIDLVDGGPAAFDRPPDAMDRYPSTLWKRYGSKGKGSGAAVAESAARYACGQAPATVESVTLYRVDQSVNESGPVGEPVVDRLASHSCA